MIKFRSKKEKVFVESVGISIVCFLVIMFIFYLLGSFIALSMDITEWALFGRFMYAIIGSTIAIVVSAFMGNYYYEEIGNKLE